jgi:hypothetical protein
MATPLLALVIFRLDSAYVAAPTAITLRPEEAASASPPDDPPRVNFGEALVSPELELLPKGDTNTVFVEL